VWVGRWSRKIFKATPFPQVLCPKSSYKAATEYLNGSSFERRLWLTCNWGWCLTVCIGLHKHMYTVQGLGWGGGKEGRREKKVDGDQRRGDEESRGERAEVIDWLTDCLDKNIIIAKYSTSFSLPLLSSSLPSFFPSFQQAPPIPSQLLCIHQLTSSHQQKPSTHYKQTAENGREADTGRTTNESGNLEHDSFEDRLT